MNIVTLGLKLRKGVFDAFSRTVLAIPNYIFYISIFISYAILEYFTFHMNPDISIQLHTLKNFVSGNGISLTSLSKDNSIVYEPCGLWPAGLVVFLTPIYLITKSAITSSIILKIVSNIFLILFLSKYLNYLGLGNLRRKSILLFFVLAVSPVIHFMPSDTLATALCLWGFYFYVHYQDNNKIGDLLLTLLLLSLSYFVKFSFLPFLFYPFAAFVLKERLAGIKKWKQGLVVLTLSTAALAATYFVNTLLIGKTTMVSTFDAFNGKAHWNQFEKMDGFLFTFGTYEWGFENFLKNHFHIDILFNWVSIFVTLCFYFLLLNYFVNKKKNLSPPIHNSINISFSAGGLIVLFLSFLTVNNPGQTWMKPYWTFVEESRYYGPVIFIGLINILVVLMMDRKSYAYLFIASFFLINLFAYDFAIHNGFWGINAAKYDKIKSNIVAPMKLERISKVSVVFFSDDSKKSEEYYYLQSQGVILLEENKRHFYKAGNDHFSCFNLKLDSTAFVYKIYPCNPN